MPLVIWLARRRLPGRARLEAEGYAVRCTLRGLGEYAAVRRLFARHAVEEWNQLKKTQTDWNAEEET